MAKGPNLTTLDPVSRGLVPLFHPRRDRWEDHFVFQGEMLVGLTAMGIATIRLLQMNSAARIKIRAEWILLDDVD